MAITKITAPASVPAAVADYEAQNAHITAFNNIINSQPFILTNANNTSIPAIAVGGYIQLGGSLYVVDTEDYVITGTPADGDNYIRISGTTTLTAEWIQDISSYALNPVYGYKASGSYALLPYLVVKNGTSYSKYQTSAITPQYKMNQDVGTTNNVMFNGVENEFVILNENVPQKVKIINAQAGSQEIGAVSGTTDSTSYVKIGEFESVAEGTVNTYMSLRSQSPSGTAYCRIYINDVAVGTPRAVLGTEYEYFSESFNVNYGDKIQAYLRTVHAPYTAQVRVSARTIYGLQDYETH